ncbi:hypothetical protein [Falsiroseomonas sp. E2-1-a20]|uniref:hypothetical protein n=1 Tax=Falsiroseomonas sp. E2-1-a20 TaxID=3239300 RepID=UPI003F2ACE86
MRVLRFVLLALGIALAGTGALALFSLATGWEIRTRGYAGSPGIAVPVEADFALVFLGIGLTCLGLAWLVGRRLR